MATATIQRGRKTLATAPAAAGKTTARQPAAQLVQCRDGYVSLRKRQAELDHARATVEQTEKKIAAIREAAEDLQKRRAAAVVTAIGLGKKKSRLDLHEYDEEEQRLLEAAGDFAIDPETLPHVKKQVEQEQAVLAELWAELRKIARECSVASCEDSVAKAITALDDPHGELYEKAEQLENARDYAAAAEFFRNPAQRQTIVGLSFEKLENGTVIEGSVFGDPGKIAAKHNLQELFKKWGPIIPGFTETPDANRVKAIVASLRDMYFVQPYSAAERQAEWDTYIGPAESHKLKCLRAGSAMDGATRNRLESRLAELEEAKARLLQIQRAPF